MGEPGHIWRQLESLLRNASERVVLVAPFIKRDVFESVITAVPKSVGEIKCVTRWTPSEVAAGVSDPEIVHLAATDARIHVYLCHALHAKLFVVDETCLVGSANLTAKAVGLASTANIEILIEVATTHPEVRAVLAKLHTKMAPATAELATLIREQSQLLLNKIQPRSAVVPGSTSTPQRWYPETRNPNRLYHAYCGERSLPVSIREGILTDLAYLDLPAGLSESEFNDAAGAILRGIPGLQELLDQERLRPEDLRQTIMRAGVSEDELQLMTETLAAWIEHFEQFYRSYGGWELRQGRELE